MDGKRHFTTSSYNEQCMNTMNITVCNTINVRPSSDHGWEVCEQVARAGPKTVSVLVPSVDSHVLAITAPARCQRGLQAVKRRRVSRLRVMTLLLVGVRATRRKRKQEQAYKRNTFNSECPAPYERLANRCLVIARVIGNDTALKVISVLLGVYIAVWSYAPVGTFGMTITTYNTASTFISMGGFVDSDGYIGATHVESGEIPTRGSLRPIVAANDLQMLCLGVTRVSAFFMYPSLVLVFTTKFRATMEIIGQSPLSLFSYDDLHELHVYCGWVVVFDGVLHTIFHFIRWADQGNMNLVFGTRSGISGFVCVICILLIGVPMMFESVRKRMAYELRKYLHYFFVVFCIAMSSHAPLSTIPNGGFACIIFPTLILWYTMDSMYVYLFMTERIDTTTFHVVATGVQLTMTVSERFQRGGESGGYCYVNFPWINKYQWHAFSLFENPANPNERQIYIQDLGDWTHKVLDALQRDTRRPIWVQGPFASPYDSAAESDNQILVAGGIGITPAISVMRKHKETRRTNLIWAVRDPHMLEFFLKHGEFSARGWNLVFYTGKQPLYVGDTSEIITWSGALVHIIRARPNLQDLIPNIIYSIESGEFVPEAFISETKMNAIAQLKDMLVARQTLLDHSPEDDWANQLLR